MGPTAIESLQHIEELLKTAESNKRRAATAMNTRSTRAHTLTYLSLRQTRGDVRLKSLLCLADLGGSEQLKKSKVWWCWYTCVGVSFL
jgi:kinesin family protein 5